MTRSTSQYFSGTIAFSPGGGNKAAWFDAVLAAIQAHTVGGAIAWETLDSAGKPTSVSAPVANIQTITCPVGSFSPLMTGRQITIAGATNAVNNGTFTFTYVSSSTGTYTNAAGVVETFPAGATWTFGLVATGPVTRDVVLRSLGDRTLVGGAGDLSQFWRLRLQNNVGFHFGAYDDWNNNTTGTVAASRRATTMDALTTTSSSTFSFPDDTSAIDYFGVVNSHEIVVNSKIGGSYFFFHVVAPVPVHVPTSRRGIVRATAGFTGTGAVPVTVAIDRASTGIFTVGQIVTIANLTPNNTAGGIRTALQELAIVDAVGAATIDLRGFSGTYGDYAIIGCDVQGFALKTATVFPVNTWAFTNHANPTQTVAANNGADVFPNDSGVFETDEDPGPFGTYPGSRVHMRMAATTPSRPFRGAMEHIATWPLGTQVDGDRMVPNDTTAQAHKFFPSITIQDQGAANMGVGIGPNAT